MSAGAVAGSCACGRVSFELEFPTRFVSHCHCASCRRAHGAAFVTYAGVPSKQFRWTAGADSLRAWETPSGATRKFCTECGSTLTYEGPKWAGEIHAVVGNLDGDLDQMPKGHAFADEAPTWCPITDDLPR